MLSAGATCLCIDIYIAYVPTYGLWVKSLYIVGEVGGGYNVHTVIHISVSTCRGEKVSPDGYPRGTVWRIIMR